MKGIFTVIVVVALSSCHTSYDSLIKINIQEGGLRSFITEYINRIDNDKGVVILETHEEGNYHLRYTTYILETDTIPPLVYSVMGGKTVLIYSGIEKRLPSSKRLKEFRKLVKNDLEFIPESNDIIHIPPTEDFPRGYSISCGSIEVYREIGHDFPLEYCHPCFVGEEISE